MQHSSDALVSFMHNPNLGAGHFPMLSIKNKTIKNWKKLKPKQYLENYKFFWYVYKSEISFIGLYEDLKT